MSSAVIAMRDRINAFLGRGTDASNPLRARPAGGPDRLFCAMVVLLCAIGLVMVFSSGAALGAKRYGDWTYFLKREVVYLSAGLVAFVFATRIDYGAYRKWSYPLLFVSVALLAALFFVGTRVNGSVRWFRLGPLSFQPSELAKFALVLYLSLLLSRNAERVKAFSMGFLPPLLMTGVVVGLVVIQPDLGAAVIIGLSALALLFISGTRTSYIALVVLVAAPVVWKVLIMGKAWRVKRLLAFLEPWAHCQGAGYQLCESLISVGLGGVWGEGLGQSRQKLGYLPEAHTDFILAIISEELGLVGVTFLITAFAILIWRGFQAALRARDLFGSYLAFGTTMLFALQALANMGVVFGLLPTKGLALPFVSYGGTSLVVSLFMAGIIANISARNPEPRPRPLFRLWRPRKGPLKNRRAPRGPRIVVDPPQRSRFFGGPALAGAAAANAAPEIERDEPETETEIAIAAALEEAEREAAGEKVGKKAAKKARVQVETAAAADDTLDDVDEELDEDDFDHVAELGDDDDDGGNKNRKRKR